MLLSAVVCVFLSIVAQSTEGFSLNYNNISKELEFQCPDMSKLDGSLMYVTLTRQKSAEFPQKIEMLAVWEKGTVTSKDLWVSVPTKHMKFLQAKILHVSCKDSEPYLYKCTVRADSDQQGIYSFSNTAVFKWFESEPSEHKMELTASPSRIHHYEKLNLSCSATVGIESGELVWESRGQSDEEFTTILEKDLESKIVQTQINGSYCSSKVTSWLLYRLGDKDEGREIKCRLNQTHQHSVVKVDLKNGRLLFNDDKEIQPSSPQTDSTSVSTVSTKSPSVQASQEKRQEEEKEEESPSPYLLYVLAAVLPVTTLSVSAVAVIFLKRRRTKNLPPILLIDSPSPSEYNYTSQQVTSGRQLPHLPQQQGNRYHSNTMDHDNTPPKLPPSYISCASDEQRPISSIYVSMSVIPGSCDSNPESMEHVHVMSDDGDTGYEEDIGINNEHFDYRYSNEISMMQEKADYASVNLRGDRTHKKQLQ